MPATMPSGLTSSYERRCFFRCRRYNANAAMQSAVFELLGIGAEEAEGKFGFLLDALKYGAPPHGGIAFGIDRIAALMAGTDSIRDVIPFPKTTTAQCLMTGAPSPVPDEQLAEVHVRVREESLQK